MNDRKLKKLRLEELVEYMTRLRDFADALPPGNARDALMRRYYNLKDVGRKAFARRYGATKRGRRVNLHELAAGRLNRRRPSEGPTDPHGFWDHQEQYNRDRRPWCAVTHTYAPIEHIEAVAVELAQEHGLYCFLPPTESWYNPSGTIPVIVARMGDDTPEDWRLLVASILA